MEFFEANNARQCGPCIRGTLGMSTVLNRLCAGNASEGELEKLKGWSNSLRHRGACAHLDGAANLAATLFLEFPAEINEHASSRCLRCLSERDEPSRLKFWLEESPG
jgi:NADH:ubiquinone oxidoreductase subunit F (NADH-binding)